MSSHSSPSHSSPSHSSSSLWSSSIARLAAAVVVSLTAACVEPAAPPDLIDGALAGPATSHKASVKRRTLTVTGTSAGSRLALRLQSSDVLAVDVNDDGSAEFTFDRSTFDRIVVDAGDGDDVVRLDETSGPFTTEELVTVQGGRGNDTLLGGFGAETLGGGPGADLVDGGPGADTIVLGDGDDTFVWDPGDASDIVEGGLGADVMVFNGSGASEEIDVRDNGGRVRFFRNVATVATDLAGVERIVYVARGGADRVVVADLTGTEVTDVEVNLASFPGSGTGDGQPDAVIVQGTAGADAIDVAAVGAAVVAEGLGARVSVFEGEPGLDALVVDGAGGDVVSVLGSSAADTIDIVESNGHALVSVAGFNVAVDAHAMSRLIVSGLEGDDVLRLALAVNPLPITLDGGEHDDVLLGGSHAEVLYGRGGHDVIDGGPGGDIIFMGEGDDTYVWDPGDASDVVEGEAGADVAMVNGSGASEQFVVGPNGDRLRVTRDIALVTMDLGGVERLVVNARGGTDRVFVDDLAGTSVTEVHADLAAYPGSGSGDALADLVIVRGTAGVDSVDIAAGGDGVVATTVGAGVRVTGGEPALDALVVDGDGGDVVNVNGSDAADVMEVYEASGQGLVSVAGFNVAVGGVGMGALNVNGLGGDDAIRWVTGQSALPLRLDGGAGHDLLVGGYFPEVLVGGPDDDVVDGGGGADSIFLGDGDDIYTWDPGDGSDVVEGEAGVDVMVFNASSASEDIELGAAAGRLRVLRNIAAVALDVAGIEHVDLNARGGSDRVVIGDLTGTGVAHVDIDLSSYPGSGTSDALTDVVTVRGSDAPEVIDIAADFGAAVVSGLAAAVRVAQPDWFDQLVVEGGGGLDTFTTGPGLDGLLILSVNQD